MLKLERYNFLVLIIFWAAVQAGLLFVYGIKTDGEAENIITNANSLLNSGHFSSSRNYSYFTEIILVYITLKLGTGFWLIIAVHLIFNLIALFYLYRFIDVFCTSKKIAFAGCVLILLCYPYQFYNSYLATESIFFSLTTIFTCYILQVKKIDFKTIIRILLLLIIICFTRPTGLFFFAATVLYLSIKWTTQLNIFVRLGIFGVFGIIGLVLINYSTSSGRGYDFILPFKEEHIICGVSSLPGVKEQLISDKNSLYDFFIYLSQHSGQFFRMALLKTKAFFGLTRTYYSLGHNLFLVFFFYSLYIFTVFTLLKFKKAISAELIYCCSIILIYWLAVVFTCDDWGNRFFLTLTPYLVIVSLKLFKAKSMRLKKASDNI